MPTSSTARTFHNTAPDKMNLRILHSIGSKNSFDHEALHDLAVTMFGVQSLRDITTEQMFQLAAAIEPGQGQWFQSSGNPSKATQKQLDYLQDLWIQKTRKKTKASLLYWIVKMRKQGHIAAKVDNPVWMHRRNEIYKVIQILRNPRWKQF